MASIPFPPEQDEDVAFERARQRELDALLERHREKLSLNDGPTDRDWAEKGWINPPVPLSYAARLIDAVCFLIAAAIGIGVMLAALSVRLG